MTDEQANVMLEHLRRIRDDIGLMKEDLHDVKTRVSALEVHAGQTTILLGNLNQRMDRSDERLGRIERRLDLVEV
jgi:hypothetical protein